jgi:hypothetical protein
MVWKAMQMVLIDEQFMYYFSVEETEVFVFTHFFKLQNVKLLLDTQISPQQHGHWKVDSGFLGCMNTQKTAVSVFASENIKAWHVY